ncbi:hypothetical protein OAQ84_00025 [Bdellovibrionales bacterium]|nr:hypothetical protein [Bdellovibrionales bacterium]
MQFNQIIQKRESKPLFTKAEIERSLRRSGVKKEQLSNLLQRAVNRDDLIRVRSGVYCLPRKYRTRIISPYELLDKVDSTAYVTHVAALSYYDLIPEAVNLITVFSEKNISSQKPFKTEIGTFKFFKVSRELTSFGVESIFLEGGIIYRIATPLKAVLDYAYANKKVWTNRENLFYDLRLDEEERENINWTDLEDYRKKYNSSFMNEVCGNLNV